MEEIAQPITECVMYITNIDTEKTVEWFFPIEHKTLVYEEIRKATHQLRDLSIVLEDNILVIPVSVLQNSVLVIKDFVPPPIYAIKHYAP